VSNIRLADDGGFGVEDELRTAIRRLSIVILLAGTTAAHADLVVWKFDNVTFDDGAMARGQFIVDTTLKQITDFDISTDAGSSLGAFQYDVTTAKITGQSIEFASGQGFFMQLDSLANVIPGATRELHFSFSGPLVPTGPASIVSDGTLGRTSYELQHSGQMVQQRIVTGTGELHPVPEPAEVLFLALGLPMLLGAVAVNRNRQKSTPQPACDTKPNAPRV
jgi:hypothetical protein